MKEAFKPALKTMTPFDFVEYAYKNFSEREIHCVELDTYEGGTLCKEAEENFKPASKKYCITSWCMPSAIRYDCELDLIWLFRRRGKKSKAPLNIIGIYKFRRFLDNYSVLRVRQLYKAINKFIENGGEVVLIE